MRTRNKNKGAEEPLVDDRIKQRFIDTQGEYDRLFSIRLPSGKIVNVGRAYLFAIILMAVVFMIFRWMGH